MKRSWSKIFLLVLFVGVLYALISYDVKTYLSFDYLSSHLDELQIKVAAAPVLSAVIYFFVYVLLIAVSFPGATIITLAGGALFGFTKGMALVSVASTLGATVAFWGTRFLFQEFVRSKWHKNYEQIQKKIDQEGAFYLFALRLNPIFPFFIINLVMGLTPMRTWTYFWVSFIGMLPGAAVYVNAGIEIGKLQSAKDIMTWSFLLSMALLGLAPFFLRRLLQALDRRRKLKSYKRPKKYDYNVIVIGGGAAGLVSAELASSFQGKVALIEKNHMGGDCLNTGCVPSKALIRSAKLMHEMKNSQKWGIFSSSARVDFLQVMERVKKIIQQIEPQDSVERFTQLGVDCHRGQAFIQSPFEVRVGDNTLTTKSIIIATGAKPFVPNIPGLDRVRYVTSDTIWDLKDLPRRLLILGGGAIGCELAQCFARLGSEVTVVEKADRLLPKSEPEASEELLEVFHEEGIHFLLSSTVSKFELYQAHITGGAGDQVVNFDVALVALGRVPNVKGFGLEQLNVQISASGAIEADEFFETNVPGIYACGDVMGAYHLTHASSYQAKYAALNALFSPYQKIHKDEQAMPSVIFTDPQVAQVGLTEEEAKKQNLDFEITQYGIQDLDRAITDGEARGFIKVLTPRGQDQILGATIVSGHAGEYLTQITSAIKHKIGLKKILKTIHPYPTFSEANQKVAGLWLKKHTPSGLVGFFKSFQQWRRS